MIQMMTAFTTEVDEIDDALSEILGQLDLGALKKNSVGIITCHSDFADSGLIEALAERMPFETIGMTTMASVNRHGMSMYGLSFAVLTSDDVTFETSLTKPLDAAGYSEKMAEAYGEARRKLPGDPAMIITFFPYMKTMSGAVLVNAFDEVCAGTPFWGSFTTNEDISYELCRTIRNDAIEQEAMAMLLMHGPVEPAFVVVSIPKQNIRDNRGIITESDGCVLKKINGLPVLEYMENMGISILEKSSTVTPFMVYYEGNSEPVALGVYSINEDGSLLCGGEMTEGAGISVGEITPDGIIATAEESIRQITQSGRRNGALLMPCVTRYVMLSPNQEDEMERVSRMMNVSAPFPYVMGYAGGEICPVPDEKGRLCNRFHNYTFSACVF